MNIRGGRATTRGTLLATAIILTSAALPAAPAAAATIPSGSVQVFSKPSGFSVSTSKRVEAICPADRPRVLGGGFTIAGGSHIEVTELQPIKGATVDSYRVSARHDEVGTSASWQLLAYAYCSSTAPGHEIVTATSSTTSDTFNIAMPRCSNGKAVTGSGGLTSGGSGQVKLLTQAEGSIAGPIRITAAGLEDLNGFSGNWSVTGYAVCVKYTTYGDIQYRSDQTVTDNTTVKKIPASCPSGTRATGGAGWIDSPATLISVVPNTSTPTRSTATGRDDSSSPGAYSWMVKSTVFCAS